MHTLLVLQKSFTSYFLFIFSGKKSFKFCADAMSTWYQLKELLKVLQKLFLL